MKKANVTKILLFSAAASLLVTGCGKNDSSKNYSKYVTLGDYKNLYVDRVVTTVTDEDVKAEIEANLSYDAEYTEITDRGAKKGDVVNIDYTGTIDGEEFDGGSAVEYEMELGSDSFFVEGFEEGIIGMTAGDTKEIPITFPEDYDGELDGKDAIFSVTLNTIYKVDLPEYNDAYVSENYGYATTAEYESVLKDELQAMNDEDSQMTACESALYQAIDNATVKNYPEELYEECKAQMESENQAFAEMFGVSDISEMFGEDYDTEAVITDSITEKMVVHEIARKEKISVSSEELDAALEEELPYSEYESIEELKENSDIDQLRYNVLYRKVLDFLAENCTFNDIPSEEYYSEEYAEDSELIEDGDAELYVEDLGEDELSEKETAEEDMEIIDLEEIDGSDFEDIEEETEIE
ncbi:MAG: trigger factor [Marvinbryantia sp.]|jgi:trigger factor